MTYHKKQIITGLLLLTALSACSRSDIYNDGSHGLTAEMKHPIVVEKQEEVMNIAVPSQGFTLSPNDEMRLKNFARKFGYGSNSNITVSIPVGSVNATTARIAAKKVSDVVEQTGVARDRIIIKTFNAIPGDVPDITVAYESFVAKAPECKNMWDTNLANAYHNTTWKGLGCATQSNLAEMIANPQDLIEMRAMGDGYGARRADIFDKYVQGTSTSASRESSETATSQSN
jgi:pilus assembly protein CpaD